MRLWASTMQTWIQLLTSNTAMADARRGRAGCLSQQQINRNRHGHISGGVTAVHIKCTCMETLLSPGREAGFVVMTGLTQLTINREAAPPQFPVIRHPNLAAQQFQVPVALRLAAWMVAGQLTISGRSNCLLQHARLVTVLHGVSPCCPGDLDHGLAAITAASASQATDHLSPSQPNANVPMSTHHHIHKMDLHADIDCEHHQHPDAGAPKNPCSTLMHISQQDHHHNEYQPCCSVDVRLQNI